MLCEKQESNMLLEDKIKLQHIIDEAKESLKFIENFTFNEFVQDSKTVHAVIRSIEVIGEAAAQSTKEFKELQAHIPWNQIAGMRNYLIHV